MIDGKKLYKWIKAQINPYGKPFEGTAYEFGLKVMDYIKAMEKQPQADWIPCEERLPSKEEYLEHDGRFIVTDGNRVYQSCYDIYSRAFKTIVLRLPFYQCEHDKCVIAWQLLPQPYKKVQNDGKINKKNR